MFKINYIIKDEDINMGNHLGNERALLFFQFARDKYLEQFSLTQLNLGNGAGLIQLNSFIEYKLQLFLGQIIEIVIDKIEIKGQKLIFSYSIYNDSRLAISGYTTMACYDYSKQKISRIPSSFLEILKNFGK